MKRIIALLLCSSILFAGCGSTEADIKETEHTQVASETIQTESETTHTEYEESEQIDTDYLSEEEYKSLCIQYDYDTLFGCSDRSIEGKYVKIELMITGDLYNFSNEHYYTCGLKTNGEVVDSYVSPQFDLFDCTDIDNQEFNAGDKLIVYGIIATYYTHTSTGHYSFDIDAKYIDVVELAK